MSKNIAYKAIEINDLLDDISYAMLEKPKSEYFLGSFVFQSKSAGSVDREKFDENDLLNGQQRMTTLLLLFSVIRDIVANSKAKERCQQCILQEADEYTNTPERSRITFCIRQDAQDFIDVVVKEVGTTQNDEQLNGYKKPPLLAKGKQTFQMVEKYLKLYKQLFDSSNYDLTGDFKFDNLLKVMSTGLPSSDWIPPLLRYYDKFGKTRLYDFLLVLDNKFSADWVTRETPTARIEAMNTAIKKIDEEGASADDVFSSGCLSINCDDLKRMLEGKIYGRRFARYILLKLDYIFQNPDQKMHFETLSVEHILPQNPKLGSQWTRDFSENERSEMTDMLGNLVLLLDIRTARRVDLITSKRKNAILRRILILVQIHCVFYKHTISGIQMN